MVLLCLPGPPLHYAAYNQQKNKQSCIVSQNLVNHQWKQKNKTKVQKKFELINMKYLILNEDIGHYSQNDILHSSFSSFSSTMFNS